MTSDTRTYELRTYNAVPGKFDALLARIRDHATPRFEKYGMTNIGYWVKQDDDGAPTETLIYLLAHKSREAAKESWAAFNADPEWLAIREAGGQVTASGSSVFLDPTEFSQLR